MQGLGRTQVTIPITSGSCPPSAGLARQAASMSGHLHPNTSVHNPHSRGREKRSPHTSSSVQLTGGDGSFLCTSHWPKQVMWSCPTTRGWGRILICTCKEKRTRNTGEKHGQRVTPVLLYYAAFLCMRDKFSPNLGTYSMLCRVTVATNHTEHLNVT